MGSGLNPDFEAGRSPGGWAGESSQQAAQRLAQGGVMGSNLSSQEPQPPRGQRRLGCNCGGTGAGMGSAEVGTERRWVWRLGTCSESRDSARSWWVQLEGPVTAGLL